jgi:acetolactate synthase-1/2/3 large subunit
MDAQCDTADYSEMPNEQCINEGPSATDGQIGRAVELLGAAKRPVMLLGGGANYSVKDDRLARLAETLNAAVVTTMASKGVFPENHPLYAFHGGSKGTGVGNYITRSADLVLALGCRFADETTSSYRRGVTYNFPETKLIHVDIDASEIGKNYNPTLGIVADVNVFCAQILAACEKAGMPYENKAYLGDIKRVCDEWLEKVKRNALADRDKITISRLLYEMRSVLPPDAILVTSSGNTQAQMLQEYVFKTPGCCITTGGFSTMGWALPAALGVKLARPARLVVALCGDGDFLMTMQEMSTAVQYSIPVLIIVANNMGWMAIKDLQIAAYGEGYAFGNDFTLQDSKPYSPDYAAAARSFGIEAARVSKIEELNPVLKEAVECGASRLIEVLVDTQYPYSGGEATGWWDVPIPEYISDRRTVYMKEMGEEDI